MHRTTRRLFAGSAVVASVLALSSAPAYAATWSVSPGGAYTATNIGNVVGTDIAKGTCNVVTLTGTARSTAGPPTKLLTLNTIAADHTSWPSINECKGPNNLRVTPTIGGLPYYFNASGPPVAGVTQGTYTSDHPKGIHGSLHASDGCDITYGGAGGAKGWLPGKFTDSTDRLSATSGGNAEVLTIDAECDPTLVGAGDDASLFGLFQVSPAQSIVYVP